MCQGTVVFMKSYIGTKSESIQPYLYIGNAKFLRIYMKGDNPYENISIKALDGKLISIIGTIDENDILTIEKIIDPISLLDNGSDNEK